jgi:integrase
LEAQDRPFLVWDLHQRGLAVRVEPSGHKSWKVVYPFHGRPRWYHIGAVDAIGLQDARKLAGRVMYQVAEGKDPAAERKAERGKGTFEELATRYVEQYAKKKNKSWMQADKLVKKHLIPRWRLLQSTDITRSDVKSAIAAISAPVVANQVLAAASAIFSWAVREEVLTSNPCQHIERHEVRSRERILSDRELPQFWAAFDTAGLLPSVALKLILLTGQRPGEVSCMHSAHLEDGWWTLPGTPIAALDWPGTKNGESHRVWLSRPVPVDIGKLPLSIAVRTDDA